MPHPKSERWYHKIWWKKNLLFPQIWIRKKQSERLGQGKLELKGASLNISKAMEA